MPVSRSDGGESPPFGETPTSGRHPNGTFASGNTASLTHGGRSQRVRGAALPEQADRRQHLADKRAAIVADLGGADALSSLQHDLIDRYLELDTVASWLGGNLVAEGPLTATGRTRAALSAYVTVVDRVHRVSSALGITRRQKAVTLNQYLTDTYEDAGSSRS